MLGLLWRWLSPQRVAGHVIDESAFPLAAQPRDVALAKQRDLLPARLALGVIEFRRRLLFALLVLAAFLDAFGENDLGVGVAVFALLDLALVVFNNDGDIVEAQSL